jgi:hypothetical protein
MDIIEQILIIRISIFSKLLDVVIELRMKAIPDVQDRLPISQENLTNFGDDLRLYDYVRHSFASGLIVSLVCVTFQTMN